MIRISVIAVASLAAAVSGKIIDGCVDTGDKAMGATGKPRIDWSKDGCCTAGATLQSQKDDWGLFCTVGGKQSAEDKAAEEKLAKALEKDDEKDLAPVEAATEANKAKDAEDSSATPTTESGDGSPVATAEGETATTATTTTATTTAVASVEAADPSDDDADPSDDGDDGSVCFPSKATVELESGEKKAMEDLAVGDMVKVGVNQFSRVFMFTHKLADTESTFLSIKTAETSLTLTPGHYLYVNGALAAAKTVSAGDSLTLGSGAVATVTSVAPVQATGLFNPQTVSGNVVVDDVLASTYTTAVEPTFAHAILAPFRALQSFVTLTALESGGGALADVAPRGQALF